MWPAYQALRGEGAEASVAGEVLAEVADSEEGARVGDELILSISMLIL
jgi:hypothetical protein